MPLPVDSSAPSSGPRAGRQAGGLRLAAWYLAGRGTRRSNRLLEKEGVGVGGGPLLHKALYPLLGPHPEKIFVEIFKFGLVCKKPQIHKPQAPSPKLRKVI